MLKPTAPDPVDATATPQAAPECLILASYLQRL